MKKILAGMVLVALIGCASFSTHVFRTEQAAVNLAYSGYAGWTNYLLPTLASTNLSVAQRADLLQASNDVKQARLKFAATVLRVDELRESYETNSAVKPQLQSALAAINSDASNIVWLINFWKNQ